MQTPQKNSRCRFWFSWNFIGNLPEKLGTVRAMTEVQTSELLSFLDVLLI